MTICSPSKFQALAAALLVGLAPAWAQQQQPSPSAAPASAAAPAAAVSQQELDQVLAPIALYPDALIAQILMAATYPLEVVEAARWSQANPGVKDKALEDAMQKQDWDPAVKSLTAVPQVLKQMNENLEWTQKLGDAFLADQKAVLATVQALRAKAQAAGNLKSTAEQTVKTEQQGSQTVYIIESSKPEVVYVPTYNPYTVYGSWWYSYPPYYMYPPAYVYPPGVAFTAGVIVGAAIWGGCNWGHNEININTNRYNNFNKTNIQNGNFQHNADHRKGVSYNNNAVAQKYNRGGDAKAAQSREQFRGRAEQGRSELQGMDRSSLQNQVQQADRASGRDAGSRSPSAGTRDAGSRDTGSRSPSAGTRDAGSRSGGGSGGFSGAGSGKSTAAASSRGSASRGSMGGAPRGGGGGRGGRR
jgi:hypothetical protein